jgi:hypothetical protein
MTREPGSWPWPDTLDVAVRAGGRIPASDPLRDDGPGLDISLERGVPTGLASDNSCPTVRHERRRGNQPLESSSRCSVGLPEGGFDSVEDRIESHGEPLLRRRLSDDRRVGN